MQKLPIHSHEVNPKPEPVADPVRPGSTSLAAMNAKLAGKKGKLFWKSFEELSGTPEFEAWVGEEFPSRAGLLNIDRRKFLTLGGAALGLAGLTGCRLLPQMKAVPYVRNPEDMVPGKAMYYTSTLVRAGYGAGVLVESHEGRPTKIEGNKNHPASLGSTDVWMQAEILGMYDPERSQNLKNNDEPADWSTFIAAAGSVLKASNGGNGVAFLSETITGPTLVAQRKALLAKFPSAKWYEYEPATRDNIYNGTKIAFGTPLSPVYHLDKAKVIVSLDSDFLLTEGNNSNVAMARDFSTGRKVLYSRIATPTMSRLYTFDSGYTITGASADHRFAVKPSQIDGIARALYAGVMTGSAGTAPAGIDAKAFAAVVADLTKNKGAAVVIPGDDQPPAIHALAHAINAALGGGATVTYITPLEADPGNQIAGLKTLTDGINAGTTKALFVLGGNPVYNAPADLQFDKAIMKVPFRVHMGRYEDETSSLCTWHLPESHFLEAWGDARSFDGTASVIQPLIAPLYDTLSIGEMLAHLIDEPQAGYDILHDYWVETHGAGTDTTAWWERILVTGVIPATQAPPVAATPVSGLEAALPAPTAAAAGGAGSLELSLRFDPTIYDGRYANNSWLQETPKPVTTITWDNAALISPRTAVKLGIIKDAVGENDATHIGDANGKQLLTLTVGSNKVTVPVWMLPGVAEDTVTVTLGYGRTVSGNVGTDMGANAYAVRTMNTIAGGLASAKVTLTEGDYQIAATQAYHSLKGINEDENRDIVLAGTLDEFIRKHGDIAKPDDISFIIPEVRAFPKELAVPNDTNPDGSLGQDANMQGYKQANGTEIPADAYREEWTYTDISQSNDKGWPTLYPEFSNKGFNAWAMSIDLTSCVGCNACSVACQAENNVPTVGKDQVGKGRHMHWIRIDHYYAGESLDDVESYFQPLACVQCEKAPCEPVCPVAATIHSHEGINQMVYNRCIGTRYCSNNCPYKVRRFNFLKWTAGIGGPSTVNYDLPVLRMLSNPEVTVRGRGVMEKCNYCIQRINEARIEAKKDERELVDGSIITACQQACPTQAIVFGDINDSESLVSKLRQQPHDYSLLSDLNTRPRTTYLGKIRNTNPDITPATTSESKQAG